ncbi:MAG TPA: hypothetical protein VHU80_02460 [Polyangiaceae bacterium]|jgi:hypothetical protein|nr:hypothetical protein [Polyangiaceae bacterium]
MTSYDSLASISDDELFATVQHLTARANVALAALLAHFLGSDRPLGRM